MQLPLKTVPFTERNLKTARPGFDSSQKNVLLSNEFGTKATDRQTSHAPPPLNPLEPGSGAMKILGATDENIRKASAVVKAGGVVIYPTETVYGLGCAPQIPEAAKRVCFIKGRADKPLPIACSDAEAARRIVEFNPAAERLAERFWPGPLMLVLPAKVEYSIWVTHGAKTLGVRVPDHDVARGLARLSGGAIMSTSANKAGEPTTTARARLGDGPALRQEDVEDGAGRRDLGEGLPVRHPLRDDGVGPLKPLQEIA